VDRARAIAFRAVTVTVLTISGMLAVHAKRAVFTALAGVPGVRAAEVELGRAVVEHDEQVTDEMLAAAIESVGCAVVRSRRASSRALPLLDVVIDPEAER